MTASHIKHDLLSAVASAYRSGKSISELAHANATTRTSIYRALARAGEPVRFQNSADLGLLRAAVQEMRPIDAVNLLLDIVEASFPEHSPERFLRLRSMGLGPHQARILLVLMDAQGAVSLDALCARVTSANSPDHVSTESIRVHLSKLRAMIRQFGWPIEIKNVWGSGYQIVRHNPDWTLPE